jgi:hypothetical protein
MIQQPSRAGNDYFRVSTQPIELTVVRHTAENREGANPGFLSEGHEKLVNLIR